MKEEDVSTEPDAIQLIVNETIRQASDTTATTVTPATTTPTSIFSIIISASVVGILGVIGVAIYLNRKNPKKT